MAASGQHPRQPHAARRAINSAILAASLIALIVIPFLLFGTSLEAWSVGLIDPANSTWFIAIIGVLLLAADVILPIPSTVVASGLGAVLGAAWGIFTTAVGLTVACAIGYFLGRFFGHDFAERKLGVSDFAYIAHLFDRRGLFILIVCRPVPVLAEASVIAAGVLGMRGKPVLLITALANLGFAAVYAGIGAAAQGAISISAWLQAHAIHRRTRKRRFPQLNSGYEQ